ncbi:MAG: phosphocholine cytidylyltransferase family protein [Deltaproteobacteria bacterium]|nr:phosphocholine cytidylyltransferase family protein [Deltaproteobacteria bacterium]MBL7084182.1 phosphocholine cytidylyltransferase family protein [Candidatus Aminicenantes bacterium]
MTKIPKTIKISIRHEEWLKSQRINFSEWIRNKLDDEIDQQLQTVDKNKFKSVILAAGKDTNLFPLTEDIPKTLLDIKGKPILQRQIEMLKKVGIDDIAVVRGYKKHKINFPNLIYFDNDDYENTGILASLFFAREFMDRDTIVLYGDILFEIKILKKLLEAQHDNILVVDRGWEKRYQESQENHPFPPELTILSNKGQGIEIKSVGEDASDTVSTSEFIGLAKLSTKACSILRDLYQDVYCPDPFKEFHQAKQIRTASFIDFIQELINLGERISALEIWRDWIEVDTFEDYRLAWKLIDRMIGGKE